MKWYVRHLWKTNCTISLCCMQPIMKRAPENNCKSYMQTKGPKKAFDPWWKDTQSLHLILLVYSGINFHIIDISSLVLSSGLVCYLYTTSLLPVCRIREENMFYIPVMPYLCFFLHRWPRTKRLFPENNKILVFSRHWNQKKKYNLTPLGEPIYYS